MTIQIIRVDYAKTQHGKDLLELLNRYALDPAGGEQALNAYTHSNLLAALQNRSDAVSFIAYDELLAVGLLNAFEGFSTFACRPLLNVHDVYVIPNYRRQAVAKKLFNAAQEFALENNCAKLTLEVLSKNDAAKHCYRKLGFKPYSLKEDIGDAVFWQKNLMPENKQTND